MKIAVVNRDHFGPFRDTKIEVKLQKFLQENNIPFVTQKKLVGRPDIFIAPNICIFADGEYWHMDPRKYRSNDYNKRKRKVAQQVWEHDYKITQKLRDDGYIVLRFWEDDINQQIEKCGDSIKEALCKND